MQNSRWFYAVAGSGVVFGLINYFQSEKKHVENSWTTNHVPSVKWDSNWDRREIMVKPEKSSENKENITKEKRSLKPTATRHLFLIRHGQYNLSASKDVDRHLTELGRKQAHLTGIRLKSLNFNYTVIYQSTMTRAKETAEIIHSFIPHVPINKCEMLCEGAPIPPEPPVGRFKPESKQFFEEGARIEAAFRKYFHRADLNQTKDSYEIFVCHANVIRYFICRVMQFPPEAWLRFSLHNCSITWVAIKPDGRVVVYTVGDCGHISPDKLTTT